MQSSFSIGEFSKLTHLPVKTLRHYHEVGVLVPADIDAGSGYRRYTVDQVPPAHLVRRLRGLDMPLAEVRTVLDAPDEPSRNRAILGFLDRMDRHLEQTRTAIASLRSLLEDPTPTFAVTLRQVAATSSLAVSGVVERDDIAAWCARTFPLLYGAAVTQGGVPAGPGGALYGPEFFEEGVGRVVAFVTTAHDLAPSGEVVPFQVPAALMAVAVHAGPFEELDRTYGSLGTYVATHELVTAGDIREHYLVSPADSPDPGELRTEVCWPIRPQPTPTGASR